MQVMVAVRVVQVRMAKVLLVAPLRMEEVVVVRVLLTLAQQGV